MGIFYDNVLKMRKNGRPLVKKETPVKVAPKTVVAKNETTEKPKETAVKTNDRRTGKKS